MKRRILTFPVTGVPQAILQLDVNDELARLRACAVKLGFCVPEWEGTPVRVRQYKRRQVRLAGAASGFELRLNVGVNTTAGSAYETLAHELTHQLLIGKIPDDPHGPMFRRALHALLKERWGFDANARPAIFDLHVYEADALLSRVIDEGIAAVARERMGSRKKPEGQGVSSTGDHER